MRNQQRKFITNTGSSSGSSVATSMAGISAFLHPLQSPLKDLNSMSPVIKQQGFHSRILQFITKPHVAFLYSSHCFKKVLIMCKAHGHVSIKLPNIHDATSSSELLKNQEPDTRIFQYSGFY